MLETTTPVSRRVAAPIIIATILTQLCLAYVVFGAATIEFGRAFPQVEDSYLPRIAFVYMQSYPYIWAFAAGTTLWALMLLLRRLRSLIWVVLYVCTTWTLFVFWMIFTLLAFYLKNQTFLV